MKSKLLFAVLIGLYLMTACNSVDNSGIPVLKLKNQQVNVILDSLFCNYAKENHLKGVHVIDINKYGDSVIMEITRDIVDYTKDEVPKVTDALYGMYEYKEKQIMVFGDCADTIFEKTSKKIKTPLYLDPAHARNEDEMPIPFEPETYVYHIEGKNIIFKNITYY